MDAFVNDEKTFTLYQSKMRSLISDETTLHSSFTETINLH